MSELLGGRKEVIDAPAIELFQYMITLNKREEDELMEKQAEFYINYLTQIFTQPLYEKPSQEFINAKKEFEEMLQPDSMKKQNRKVYEWDFERKERLEGK